MQYMIAPGTVTKDNADTLPPDGTPGFATNGNPAAGVPATRNFAWWMNMVMMEIIQPVLDAGLELDATNWGQLSAAITAQINKAIDPVIQDMGNFVQTKADDNSNKIDSLEAAKSGNLIVVDSAGAQRMYIPASQGVISASGNLQGGTWTKEGNRLRQCFQQLAWDGCTIDYPAGEYADTPTVTLVSGSTADGNHLSVIATFNTLPTTTSFSPHLASVSGSVDTAVPESQAVMLHIVVEGDVAS